MIQNGTILGQNYAILEHIGSGGMADVYKAKCEKTGQYVAIKVLRKEYEEDEDAVRRFSSEARATIDLEHPNLVRVYEEGKDQDIHYIVMELAEGMTLKRYIRRYGRLSVRETVDFAMQIAGGIQAAHEHNLIHRDIKPQNIIVSDSGKLKVTDFGIAKAATGDTISGAAMGTVHYLSPEQARGGYSDERSDMYSLGITIYEMATGKVPFDGENTVSVALKHIREDIVPPRNYFPDIPVSLENIILKCTKKRPEERYQTAAELIKDLEQVFTSPDGNYVYAPLVEDDSPTKTATDEELAEIKNSLKEDNGEGEGEDYEDDDSMNPKMERMIIIIIIVVGIILAGILIYVIGTSAHLFNFGNNSATEVTEETTEAAETKATVTVPSFLNMTKSEAQRQADEVSLTAKFVYETGADVNDSSLVVTRQQYARGETLEEGTAIRLTLGETQTADSSRVEVPALVNCTESEAKAQLNALGLSATVVYDNSDTVKSGYVIKQNPKGGSIVDKGFSITITVSKGVSQVKVPSLYGLSQNAAERELNRVGLVLGKVTSDYSGAVGVGDVIEQGIASGTSVDKGTAVSIVISLGEQETYHYESTVTISQSPFSSEEETGKVELVLSQGSTTKTIYTNDNASSAIFPLEVDLESKSDGSAKVILYLNGSQAGSYSVGWNAVAD